MLDAMLGDCTIAVSHARGNDRDALYEKEPKTSSPARTIPFAARILQALRTMRAEPRRQMAEFGLAGDPFALGSGAREPPLMTPPFPARSRGLLQGERPLLHVPRPAPHSRDHDDRRRLRHARHSELPRAREGEHGPQHLRRHGPQRQEGRRLKGAGLPRRGHGGVPHRVRPLRQRARLAAGRPPTFTSTSSRPCSPRREPSRAERSRPPRKRHGIRRFPGKPTRRRLEIMVGGIKPGPLDTISDHKRGRGRC